MFDSIKSKILGASVVLGSAVATFAEDANNAVSIPDAGVDVAGYVTAGITSLGGVFAVVVGGYFCFLIIRKALKAARSIA